MLLYEITNFHPKQWDFLRTLFANTYSIIVSETSFQMTSEGCFHYISFTTLKFIASLAKIYSYYIYHLIHSHDDHLFKVNTIVSHCTFSISSSNQLKRSLFLICINSSHLFSTGAHLQGERIVMWKPTRCELLSFIFMWHTRSYFKIRVRTLIS